MDFPIPFLSPDSILDIVKGVFQNHIGDFEKSISGSQDIPGMLYKLSDTLDTVGDKLKMAGHFAAYLGNLLGGGQAVAPQPDAPPAPTDTPPAPSTDTPPAPVMSPATPDASAPAAAAAS
jgi:hypothetical protein